jgi:hypothetical protein
MAGASADKSDARTLELRELPVTHWSHEAVLRYLAAELEARGWRARVPSVDDAKLINQALAGWLAGPGLAACEYCRAVFHITRRRRTGRTSCPECTSDRRARVPANLRRESRPWWSDQDRPWADRCLSPYCDEMVTRTNALYCSDRCRKATERYLDGGGSIETPRLPYRLTGSSAIDGED